jgi:hypothetical protein
VEGPAVPSLDGPPKGKQAGPTTVGPAYLFKANLEVELTPKL